MMTELTEQLREYAQKYDEPPFGREVDGTKELLEEAAARIEELECVANGSLDECDHRVFDGNTDREGICPVCGKAITYTGSHEIDDSGGTILWICANCGASGKEGYNRVFDRHYEVMDRDGNLIPGRPE